MRSRFFLAALAALMICASQARAQTYPNPITFEDGTDNGFGPKFGNDAGANFTVASIGGSMRMFVPRTGGFQEADVTPTAVSALGVAELAGMTAPTISTINYDYYIDTSAFATPGTFLQIGMYVNGSSAPFDYHQDFGAVKEVELSGAQLASGQVFQGHVAVNITAAGLALPPAESPFRIGFILNGDSTGPNAGVWFDNVGVTTVPEPASLVLMGMGMIGAGIAAYRRRAKA